MSAYVVLVYGILVVLGGVMGYVKARSVPSITMGAISGLLLIFCALQMFKALAWATYLALAISVALGVMFAVRYKGSRKFMPAGLMVVLSVLVSLILLV